MILGLGVDLVEVTRLERAVARQGEHFLRGFLSLAEIDQSRLARDPCAGYALAFAAKEALFKALGTGRAGSLRWHDVEMVRKPSGAGVFRAAGTGSAVEPTLWLRGETERAARALGVRRTHLSTALHRRITGEGLALALVVLEGGGTGADGRWRQGEEVE